MTPGSREWVVRSLRDWALGIGQGMALVTYNSPEARNDVIGAVTRELEQHGLKCSTLLCNARTGPQAFIREIAANRADVLFVLDVNRLLFGDKTINLRSGSTFNAKPSSRIRAHKSGGCPRKARSGSDDPFPISPAFSFSGKRWRRQPQSISSPP